ncbi:unnamed protein product [marine sediment metagenome]|uniref:Membrane protein insertion efficiency factor YidD n=1 Tax=marine sediment metagenome TaxID=412755 RepID=X0ZSC3_9ZZZZ
MSVDKKKNKNINIISVIGKKVLVFILRTYKRYLSRILPPSCRFYPTCSTYTIEAIEKYGFFKGGLIAILRILRCNPFSKGGYDPVR